MNFSSFLLFNAGSRLYIILVTVFCVFLPLFAIIFSYTRIILLVKQSDALMQMNGVNKQNMKGSDLQLTWVSNNIRCLVSLITLKLFHNFIVHVFKIKLCQRDSIRYHKVTASRPLILMIWRKESAEIEVPF